MKIFDRYIIATFLKNYLLSFAVLVGLYVVLDMIFNFDELIDVKRGPGGSGDSLVTVFLTIGDFYFYQIFFIFVHLSAIIPIVAASFTLVRLARFNELTAVLAAGVPMLRVAMPIILVSMVLNVLLLVDQEFLIPSMIPKLTREHTEIYSSSSRSFSIQAMQADKTSRLYAGRYTAGGEKVPPRIDVLDVMELSENLTPVSHLLADSAEWDAAREQWNLTNGRRRSLSSAARTLPEQPVKVYKTNATPEEIALYHSGDFVQLLSTSRINQLLQRQSYGMTDLLRVKHTRFTQPLSNIIILLLAISMVLSRDPTGLKTAAVKCVAVTGLGLGVVFLSYHLAGSPPPDPAWVDRWPALMAWMPVFILGPLAVWLLDRVKT